MGDKIKVIMDCDPGIDEGIAPGICGSTSG